MTICPEHPEHPEIPYPLPPERFPPRRTEPVVAAGAAVALVAGGTGTRRSASNATFCLRINDRQTIEGTTSDIVRRAGELDALRGRFVATLAATTGLDASDALGRAGVGPTPRPGRHAGRAGLRRAVGAMRAAVFFAGVSSCSAAVSEQ